MNKQPNNLEYKINKVLDQFERAELVSSGGYKSTNIKPSRRQALKLSTSH